MASLHFQFLTDIMSQAIIVLRELVQSLTNKNPDIPTHLYVPRPCSTTALLQGTVSYKLFPNMSKYQETMKPDIIKFALPYCTLRVDK
jgi:hypothetical protein